MALIINIGFKITEKQREALAYHRGEKGKASGWEFHTYMRSVINNWLQDIEHDYFQYRMQKNAEDKKNETL